MLTTEPKTKAFSVRLPAGLVTALNAARPWKRHGFLSRNAWIASLIRSNLDLRTVPKESRQPERALKMKHRPGQL